MQNNTRKHQSNENPIAYATEILETEEQPMMTDYLWLKIQTMAKVIITEHKNKEQEERYKVGSEIYDAVVNKRRINLKIIKTKKS